MKCFNSISISLIIIVSLSVRESKAQYLSDKDETYKAIEQYQEQYLSKNFLFDKLGSKYFTKNNAYDFLQKTIESMFGRQKDDDREETFKQLFQLYIPNEYPTRFQDPFQYLIYSPLITKIHEASKNLYPAYNYTPKYGTFYYNSIAAERKSAKGDYLILIHSKYVTFCHQMGKVALQFFKNIMDYKDFERLIPDTALLTGVTLNDKQMPINLLYTFFEFNYEKFPINDSLLIENEGWLQQDFVQKALQYWNNASETFLIGHEYAHALLKHTSVDDDNSNFITDTITLRSWLNEVQADSVSQEILNTITIKEMGDPFNTRWNKYLLYGGVFMLNTLRIFEDGQYTLNNGAEMEAPTQEEMQIMMRLFTAVSPLNEKVKEFVKITPRWRKMDHPPTEIRIALIKHILSRQLQNGKFDTSEDVGARLAESMIYFLQAIDRACGPAFKKAYSIKDQLNKIYN